MPASNVTSADSHPDGLRSLLLAVEAGKRMDLPGKAVIVLAGVASVVETLRKSGVPVVEGDGLFWADGRAIGPLGKRKTVVGDLSSVRRAMEEIR
jgi:hypothetical protein